jgi:Glycosyl hydrolase family 9
VLIQVPVGALVSGPSIQDAYVDYRGRYMSAEIAIDYQTGYVSLLVAALQLPADFWKRGNLTALAGQCEVNYFTHYNWTASAVA